MHRGNENYELISRWLLMLRIVFFGLNTRNKYQYASVTIKLRKRERRKISWVLWKTIYIASVRGFTHTHKSLILHHHIESSLFIFLYYRFSQPLLITDTIKVKNVQFAHNERNIISIWLLRSSRNEDMV